MVRTAKQWGGNGRSVKHAAVLLVFGGLVGGSFMRGSFVEPSRASVDPLRTVLPIQGVRQVPGEYATVQSAIDAAAHGETVLIASGVYCERVSIRDKRITLRGESALAQVHIVGDGMAGPIISIIGAGATGTSIENIAITGAVGENACGVLVESADCRMRSCELERNQGSGIVMRNCELACYGCTFDSNEASVAGGGLHNEGGTATLTDCVIRSNRAGTFGGGIYSRAGRAILLNSSVSGNSTTSGAWGGGIYSDAGELVALDTTIDRNGSVDAGGGVFVAGGEASLSGCQFIGNYSERGWSIGSSGAQVHISDSTVCGDRGRSTVGDGIIESEVSFQSDCLADRNLNGRDDAQEIAMGWVRDCDRNGVPDDFDPDCNGNGMVDRCEIAAGWVTDCNGNLVPDRCEIEMGLESDVDGDWRIDDCAGE